jgi:hypothetical protein
MGGMGSASVHPPGKSGLTFDHILSWFQGELHNLTGVMTDIHDMLGGSLVILCDFYLGLN